MYTIAFLFIATVGAVRHYDCSGYDHTHISPDCPSHGWFPGRFENFVVFGDSYTDESRLSYFAAHNNTPPPTGKLLPEALDASDGGRVWPRCSIMLYKYFMHVMANVDGYRYQSIFWSKAL